MKSLLCIVITAVFAGLSGCGATYINIPALPGDLASNNPNDPNAQKVEAVALRHVLRRWPVTGRYAVRLPEGTNSRTHHHVIARLPEGEEHAMATDGSGAVPVYRVARIYVRGSNGQVDVVKPAADGSLRLVSVYVANDWQGWYAVRSRVWNMPVARALAITEPNLSVPPVEPPQDADTQAPPTTTLRADDSPAPPLPVTDHSAAHTKPPAATPDDVPPAEQPAPEADQPQPDSYIEADDVTYRQIPIEDEPASLGPAEPEPPAESPK